MKIDWNSGKLATYVVTTVTVLCSEQKKKK